MVLALLARHAHDKCRAYVEAEEVQHMSGKSSTGL